MCVLQGLRNAGEVDCKVLCWSFLQEKKEHTVFFPYRPLTARHKFLLRLSRKPHPWTKIKKRKLQTFLWVNANKILKSSAPRNALFTFIKICDYLVRCLGSASVNLGR